MREGKGRVVGSLHIGLQAGLGVGSAPKKGAARVELAGNQQSLLAQYLREFDGLIGDRRTGEVFDQTVLGIIGSESLVAAKNNNGAQRIRRMASGDTTKRSYIDAEHLVERLQERGAWQLRGEDKVWVILDPSELRKPYAHEMENLMKVRALDQGGTVAGYRTLNALGDSVQSCVGRRA